MTDTKFPDIVELNVGGRHVSTFLSTLTKYPDSMLAAMFSGRHPVARDKDGRFFIDADGDIFTHLLNFLRFETMPPSDKVIQVKEYAEYFGIDELKTRLNDVTLPAQDEILANWKASIPGYAMSLSSVKEQITSCNIDVGNIIMYVMAQNACPKIIPCPDSPSYYERWKIEKYTELQVQTSCDVTKQGLSLLTLLARDLKPYGFCISMKPTTNCCHSYTMLKLS